VKPLVLSFSASRYGELITLGDFIKKARLEKGLKQAEVARVVWVDEMTIVNWGEVCDAPMRNRAKVSQLCHLLSLSYPEMPRDPPRPSPPCSRSDFPAA